MDIHEVQTGSGSGNTGSANNALGSMARNSTNSSWSSNNNNNTMSTVSTTLSSMDYARGQTKSTGSDVNVGLGHMLDFGSHTINHSIFNLSNNHQQYNNNNSNNTFVSLFSDSSHSNLSDFSNFSTNSSTNDSDYDYDYSAMDMGIPLEEILPVVFVYGLTLVLGIVGNALVIFSIAWYRRMRSVTNIFLTSLASADLLLVLICVPIKVS